MQCLNTTLSACRRRSGPDRPRRWTSLVDKPVYGHLRKDTEDLFVSVFGQEWRERVEEARARAAPKRKKESSSTHSSKKKRKKKSSDRN